MSGNQRFSITPSAAAEDKELSDSVFRTLACLGVYGNKSGWCWPSLKTIGDMRGVSKERISADIKILVSKGYVQREERFKNGSQTTNMYRILFDVGAPPPDEEVNPPLTSEVNPPLTPEVNQNALFNAPIKEEEGLSKVLKLYERNIGAIPPMLMDSIKAAINTYSIDWFEPAFKCAVEKKALNWRYIETILKNWKQNGYGWKPGDDKKSAPASEPKPQYLPDPRIGLKIATPEEVEEIRRKHEASKKARQAEAVDPHLEEVY